MPIAIESVELGFVSVRPVTQIIVVVIIYYQFVVERLPKLDMIQDMIVCYKLSLPVGCGRLHLRCPRERRGFRWRRRWSNPLVRRTSRCCSTWGKPRKWWRVSRKGRKVAVSSHDTTTVIHAYGTNSLSAPLPRHENVRVTQISMCGIFTSTSILEFLLDKQATQYYCFATVGWILYH